MAMYALDAARHIAESVSPGRAKKYPAAWRTRSSVTAISRPPRISATTTASTDCRVEPSRVRRGSSAESSVGGGAET